MLNNSSILITGGTGSSGQIKVQLLQAKYGSKKLTTFSPNAMIHCGTGKLYGGDGRVRFFIGDVCNRDRLHPALKGIDFAAHAAESKIVPTAGYNLFDADRAEYG